MLLCWCPWVGGLLVIILIIMMIVTMVTIIAIMVVMMMMMMHPLFVSLGVCACVLLRASAHVSSCGRAQTAQKHVIYEKWSLTQADAQWIVAQWLLSSLTQPVLN